MISKKNNHQSNISNKPSVISYEELLRKNYQVIYRQCFLILKNTELAQEATQEVFLVAYGRLDELQDKSAALSWLRKIARNFCLNLLKRKKKHDEILKEIHVDLTQSLGQHDPGFLGSVEARSSLRKLNSFDSLSTHIFSDYVVKGQSMKEIAKEAGVTLSAIKMRMKRFKKINAIVF